MTTHHRKRFTHSKKASLLAACVAASSAHTYAEDQDSFTLEEIVVTAQKRAQSSQDVGIAVSALSGKQLRNQNIINAEALSKTIPNVGLYDVSGGVPVVIIRGVGLQNFRVNDTPATSFYIDEVYQTSVAMAGFTMFDLERVEVLKGPQGGLYGRNAVGGAIQVISTKPSLDEMNGYFDVGFGQYNRTSLEGAVGGPVSDTVAVRVAGRLVRSGDTYYTSTTSGFGHGEEDKWALRGQILISPSDTVNVLFKVHGGADSSETPLLRPVGAYNRFGINVVPNFADGALFNYAGANPGLHSICPAIRAGGRNGSSCETVNGQTPAEQGVIGIYDSASNLRPALNNDWWGVSLNFQADFGSLSLASITAYDRFNHGRLVDFDGVATVHEHIDYVSEIEAWSQEIRLANETDSVSWLIGANYAEDTLKENTFLEGTSGLVPLAFSGLTLADQPYYQKTIMKSAFAKADVILGGNTTLVLEARYTNEDKAFTGGVNLTQINVPLSYTDAEDSYSALSGKIGLELSVTDDALLYASVSKGFKSGGFFGGFATANDQLLPFDKETILAYEAGVKSDWLEGRLRLNASAFYYDRSDMQASATDPTAIVPIKRLTNVGDARTYGAELDVAWLISEHVSFIGGAGYLNSKIKESGLVVGDIFAAGQHTLEGARLPNTPEFNANLTARYEKSVSEDLLVRFDVEYSYRTEQDLSIVVLADEAAVLTEEAYSLVNIRAALESLESEWRVGVWVENLFGKEYRTVARADTLGGIYEIYGAPSIWGVSVSKSF